MQAEAERLRQASLGQVADLFGKYTPPSLLQPADTGPGSRERLFSTRTTFWAFLGQILVPNASCRETVRKVQAWQAAGGLRMASSNTSAYCQARGRLDDEELREIHERVVHRIAALGSPAAREFGRPVKVVDGTGVSMPDTPENQSEWPQTKAQKPGCGFPLAKLVGLFDLDDGLLLDWAEGSKRSSEHGLFRSLWHRLDRDDILLGDKGFGSYACVAALADRGVDSVTRLHHGRKFDFRSGKKLGPRDRLTTWTKPVTPGKGWTRDDWKALPDTLAVRIVEIRIAQPGFRVRTYVLATTLIDPIAWPAETLARMYFRRWSVELFFRDIKTTMGMDILRCKTPPMVRKELIFHAIAYNCIRGLMCNVAALYQMPVHRISFKGSVDTLRQWADAFHIHSGKPRKQAEMLDLMLQVIAEDPVPERPDRSEPRAKKRRPKPFQLLTVHRHEMVVSDSRRN